MIDVDFLFQTVTKTLGRKGKSGYQSNDEWNRISKMVEDVLYNYYYKFFEEKQKVMDALNPFLKESEESIVSGVVALPSDYKHIIPPLRHLIITQDADCDDEPTKDYRIMHYLNAGEEAYNHDSAIRKSTLTYPHYTFVNNSIKCLPTTLTGKVLMKYLRTPTYAVRSVDLDGSNDQENYNQGNSTQFEWPEQEQSNLVDLFLFYKGLEIRENPIVQWVAGKSSLTQKQ